MLLVRRAFVCCFALAAIACGGSVASTASDAAVETGASENDAGAVDDASDASLGVDASVDGSADAPATLVDASPDAFFFCCPAH